jgi:hypothetical protein
MYTGSVKYEAALNLTKAEQEEILNVMNDFVNVSAEERKAYHENLSQRGINVMFKHGKNQFVIPTLEDEILEEEYRFSTRDYD